MAASRNSALIFFIVLLFSCPAFSQEAALDLNKKIRIKPGMLPLDSVFHIAARQTGAVFSYDANRLDVRQRVRLTSGEITLEKILTILVEANGLCVKQLENHIIVTQCGKNAFAVVRNEVPKTKQKAIQDTSRHSEHKKPVRGIANQKNAIDSVVNDHPVVLVASRSDSLSHRSDTVRVLQTTEKIPAVSQSSLLVPDSVSTVIVTKSAADKQPMQTMQSPPQKKSSARSLALFAKIGVSLDESRYSGLFLQAGIPVLYATLSANTNFKVSYIHYGLGTGFRITTAARILLTITLGNIKRSGHYTDSVRNQYPVQVTGNLMRASLALEIFLSKKIGIQAGPVFNYLQTHYFINNMRSNLNNIERGDEIFSTIRPPYLIVNTYLPTTDSNVKTWIGLQVSVVYRIKR